MKSVRILLTGGTLDKIHDPVNEGLGFPETAQSQVPALMEFARCHFTALSQVLQKDSLDFTDDDRDKILRATQDADEKCVVITHGTGTMGQTARFLSGRVRSKTVILTGAIRPFSLGRSDAQFNLGGAVIAAQLLPPGVYGVMNGRAIPASRLEKDKSSGRFDMTL